MNRPLITLAVLASASLAVSAHAQSGAVRPLGVSGAKRSLAFPDLPTSAEAGVPGYEAATWSGVVAPAGTPKIIVDKLNAAINRAVNSQLFKDRFAQIGDEPAGGTPEAFATLINEDAARMAKLVKEAGIKFD